MKFVTILVIIIVLAMLVASIAATVYIVQKSPNDDPGLIPPPQPWWAQECTTADNVCPALTGNPKTCYIQTNEQSDSGEPGQCLGCPPWMEIQDGLSCAYPASFAPLSYCIDTYGADYLGQNMYAPKSGDCWACPPDYVKNPTGAFGQSKACTKVGPDGNPELLGPFKPAEWVGLLPPETQYFCYPTDDYDCTTLQPVPVEEEGNPYYATSVKN